MKLYIGGFAVDNLVRVLVEDAFGSDVGFAQLVNLYGVLGQTPEVARRYSPAECRRIKKTRIRICATFRLRISSAPTSRCGCTCAGLRGFPRGFRKKLENCMHAVSLHFMFYLLLSSMQDRQAILGAGPDDVFISAKSGRMPVPSHTEE